MNSLLEPLSNSDFIEHTIIFKVLEKFLDLPEDPSELVTKNREFLSELKKCGFDGREVGKMLQNFHGIMLSNYFKTNKKGWIEFDELIGQSSENETWISKTELKKYKDEYESLCKNVDYASRSLKGIINNPIILKNEKDVLEKIIDRLSKIKKQLSYKPFEDQPLNPDVTDIKRQAKSIIQMIGFQVVEIVSYIETFMEKTKRLWKRTDIFSLICEIFNELDRSKPYTKEGIKTLYDNNLWIK